MGQEAISPAYARYEPRATELVLDIQAGINVERNQNQLSMLLLPLVMRIVRAETAVAYRPEEQYAVAQSWFFHFVIGPREGRRGQNGHVYQYYIYKYDHGFTSDRVTGKNNSFCGFLANHLSHFLRHDDNINAILTNDRHFAYSLDEEPDEEGVSLLTVVENRQALYESREEERSNMIEILVERMARPLAHFIDEVNGLDEKKAGSRSISERHILSYHLWALTVKCVFAFEGFRDDTIIGEHFKESSAERFTRQLHKRIQQGDAEIGLSPSCSWALQKLTAETDMNYQILYRLPWYVMGRLEKRLKDKGIGAEHYLEENAVLRDTVDRWIIRVIAKVHDPYREMVEEIEEIREALINERN